VETFQIIDTESHIEEPVETWDRLDAEFQTRRPFPVTVDKNIGHNAARFYPPSQKATGVSHWMNARRVPSVALAEEGSLRRVPPDEACGEVPRP
jgi:hypothetical protein